MKKFLSLLFCSVLFLARASAQTATVTPSATTYDAAGGQMTFNVAITFPTTAKVVQFSAKPLGSASWTYVSTTAITGAGGVVPAASTTLDPTESVSIFGWAYSEQADLSSGSVSFSFALAYPAGMTGAQTIELNAKYRSGETVSVITSISIPNLVLQPTPVAASITNQPVSATVASGGGTTFTAVVVGTPTPTYKWERSTNGGLSWTQVANDSTFAGATTTTLTVTGAAPAMNGNKFRLTASNGVAADAISSPATLTVTFAPTIITQPRSQSASTGGSAVISVVASASPAPTYQWKKGGVNVTDVAGHIAGATTASLTLTGVVAGDAGNYTVVVSNGIGSPVTSDPATLSVVAAGFGASHALNGTGYTPGGTVTITNTITYVGELSSLSWSVLLPTGWSFESGVNAGSPSTSPSVNDISVLGWAWSTAPASGSTFTYTLKIPANASGDQSLTALVEYGASVPPILMVATPDPLLVKQITYHSADTNQNFKIDLSELTRVIALYNTRFDTGAGKVRTGAYKLKPVGDTTSPDGFVTEALRDPAVTEVLTVYHSADTNRNGKIDLSELTRVIALYNTRYDTGAGKVRTGAYKPKPADDTTSPDGYVTEATRAP